MKKIFSFLVALAMSISLSSCVTTVSAQDDVFDGEVDATVVVSYGTPYIYNGMIEYYFYRGWYYYPCCANNNYYFHRYRRVLPSPHFYDWYKPIPRDRIHPRPHHNAPHHRPHAAPQRPHHNNHHGGNIHNRPSRPNHHGGGMSNRPHNPPRSSTRGGHFGGRR